jgi:hydrogenase maturation protease
MKNIIIGIGNLLFCDDGIGIIAIDFLKKNYTFEPELELLDGGTLGFNLAEYFLEYENVIILDTISTDDYAGSIYKIPSNKLLGGSKYKNTAHEVEVIEMLEACELHDKKAKVTIIAITPEDINSVKIGLSDTLSKKFIPFINEILNEIYLLNIKPKQKNNIPLKEILNSLSH